MNVYDNSSTWVGCARETIRGTAQATPVFWVPATVLSPRTKVEITELLDVGDRGMMTTVWDQVQGTEYVTFSFKCLAHPDVLPHIFRSVLGSPDTTSVGPGGSTLHAFSLLNNDGQADQPPSYTWFDWDGFRLRTIRGCQTDVVQVIWQSETLIELYVKVIGIQQAATTGPPPNPTMPNVQPVASWDCINTLAGVTTPTVTKALVMFNRHVVPITTLGQQTPYSVFAGPLDIVGSMSVINQADTELAWYLNNPSVTFNLNCAQAGAVNRGFTLDMASVKTKQGEQQRDSNGLIVTSFGFTPLPNSTDATAGGYSPIKATVQNFTSSGY